MNTKPQLLPDDPVSCDICMKEIPVSEAKSDEASDYVVFYYGLDCYKTWSEQTPNGKHQTSTPIKVP